MKIGVRKPSVKKSIKARTTGKLKRSVREKVDPFYGKKGMGYIKDTEKAIYNKVYNKTTVGVSDIISGVTSSSHSTQSLPTNNSQSNGSLKVGGVLVIAIGAIALLLGLLTISVGGILFVIAGGVSVIIGLIYLKANKKEVED